MSALDELRTRFNELSAKVEAGNNTADQLIAGMVSLQRQVTQLQGNGSMPEAAALELLTLVNSTIASLDEQARQNAEALGLIPIQPPEGPGVPEIPESPEVPESPRDPVPLAPPAVPPQSPPQSPSDVH